MVRSISKKGRDVVEMLTESWKGWSFSLREFRNWLEKVWSREDRMSMSSMYLL